MIDTTFKYVKCAVNKANMNLSEDESDALMAELMMCYLSKGESVLMSYLLEDDVNGFKKYAHMMNESGYKISNALKDLK